MKYKLYWRNSGTGWTKPRYVVKSNAEYEDVIQHWYAVTPIKGRVRYRLEEFAQYLEKNHPNQKLDNLEFIWNLWKIQQGI